MKAKKRYQKNINWRLEKACHCPNCHAFVYPSELKRSPVSHYRWYQFATSLVVYFIIYKNSHD